MSKREVKIVAVEMAISASMPVEVAGTKEQEERDSAKLAEFLKLPFRDEF